jgi:hypothetical protein
MSIATKILSQAALITASLALTLPQAIADTPANTLLSAEANHPKIHFLPKHPVRAARSIAYAVKDTGPLKYFGGSVMTGNVTLYAIYWAPPQLQNGNTASMASSYRQLQSRLLADFPYHGLASNLTQYYQQTGGVKTYISGQMTFGGEYVDTTPYPSSLCPASTTPDACITDADIQKEVKKVMALKGWKGGTHSIFMVYTAKDEDVCDSTSPNSQCANLDYCGYHSYIAQTTPVVYAIMPYGDPIGCGTPQNPNNLPAAEAAASTASHEISEAVTDPLINGWMSAQGSEIADLCDYIASSAGYKNTWKNGTANQMWNGHYYELELEYDNHTKSCVTVGP